SAIDASIIALDWHKISIILAALGNRCKHHCARLAQDFRKAICQFYGTATTTTLLGDVPSLFS
ncbi:MAG: hypothetical protein IJ724_00225, partial [Muribaculaceae bacterium]|nr:hypothetical protein [Muribaculaceae bacterium]